MIEENFSQKKNIWMIVCGGGILIVAGIAIWFFFFKNKITTIAPVVPPVSVTVSTTPSEQPVVDPYPNDKDRDGIDDTQEKEMGLSSRDFDTDSDGLSDADEIDVWKTDPKKFDTDSDKFGDGYEVLNGYNPTGSGKIIQSQ